VRFVKAHAYGNDFLYVKKSDVPGVPLDALARRLCDRRTAIGADGLIVSEPTADGASMQLFNADGSRAEVSGNGVRALGALLLKDEPRTAITIAIHTEAGLKRLDRVSREGARQLFTAAMGLPRDLRQTAMSVDGESLPVILVDFGNPHAVLLGALPPPQRFDRLGRALSCHPMFPGGTNVEFAEVEASDSVRILIWERGVGPTASSGTGTCAALIAAAAFGGAGRQASVIAPGGAQRVEWRDETVYLTGWAEVLFEGEWLGSTQIPRP
jgi:diaminopimelate epimerase